MTRQFQKITIINSGLSAIWGDLVRPRNSVVILTEANKPPYRREIIVAELPLCDFCSAKAQYDAKTRDGPWAYVCEYHYRLHCVGLGVGKGQRLIEDKTQQPLIVEKPQNDPKS